MRSPPSVVAPPIVGPKNFPSGLMPCILQDCPECFIQWLFSTCSLLVLIIMPVAMIRSASSTCRRKRRKGRSCQNQLLKSSMSMILWRPDHFAKLSNSVRRIDIATAQADGCQQRLETDTKAFCLHTAPFKAWDCQTVS
jgi:hypothetical protein